MRGSIVVIGPASAQRDALVALLQARHQRTFDAFGISFGPDELQRLLSNPPRVAVVDGRAHDAEDVLVSLLRLQPTPHVILITNGQEVQPPAGVQVVPIKETPNGITVTDLEAALAEVQIAPEVIRRIAVLLRRAQREIVARWLQQISVFPEFAARPDLNLDEMRDHVPLMVQAMIDILDGKPSSAYFRPGSDAHRAALAHAHTRIEQNLPPVAIIKEHHALHREIWYTLQQDAESLTLSVRDVFFLEDRLSFILNSLTLIVFEHFMHHWE